MSKIIDECKTALIDGLGKTKAKTYAVSEWNTQDDIGFAYSKEEGLIYLLFLCRASVNEPTPAERLEVAKEIYSRHGLFSVPARKEFHDGYWGTKSNRVVTAYKYIVY
ncbi:TPA: hypothetical protein ACXG57_002874 [Escherichia coli]